MAILKGANPDIIEMIREEYAKYADQRRQRAERLELPGDYRKTFGYGEPEINEKIRQMGGGALESHLLMRFSCDDPAWLCEYSKYIVHFHGKFYELLRDENGSLYEPSIDYQGIIDALVKNDYPYWISTEWEGQGLFRDPAFPEIPPKGEEYVKLHHDMIREMESRARLKFNK